MSLLSFMGLGSSLASMIPGVGKVASGMLSTLGGGLFNLGQNYFNAREADENRQFQREERLAAQQFNLDMWNLNNKYNSPVEQLKRAQAAGINPNDAINGMKGATSQPVTTTPMSGNMASSSGSIAANLLTQDAVLDNLIQDAVGKKIQNSYAPRLNDRALKQADEDIKATAAKRGLDEANAKQILEMLPLLKNKTGQEIEEIKARAFAAVEQANKAVAETDNIKKQGEIIDKQGELLDSQKAISQFESEFREAFGVAPGSGLVDGIIQLAVSGDKGLNIVKAMLQTLFSSITGAIMYGIEKDGEFEKWKEENIHPRINGFFTSPSQNSYRNP